MSYKIINKQILAENVKRIDIAAPDIARRIRPGQFVSVCPEEDDEHIPLTVTSCHPGKGSISLIFPEMGHTTRKLGALPINESIFSMLGPLGRPARIEKKETAVCVAAGMGIAQILPICRAFKNTGTKVVGMIGAKTKRALMLEPQMRLACHKIFIATDDGSYERRGLATDILKEFIERQEAGNANVRSLLVYAIGSAEMMRTVCSMTKERGIETLVKLNPVMVDCMGMCGSCRVKVGGKTVLACVEGPEFDGHKVDFEDLSIRMNAYEEPEPWGSRPLKHNLGRSGSRTLTKFLSDILKS